MAWTKEDRSFKTLINRRTTDSTNKFWYNEFSDNTLNIHISEIWTQSINSSPAQAVSDGVAEERTLFTLTLDGTVPNQQCYYAYESGQRLKDWIGTKYGEGYSVRLYDNNNNEIFTTDASQWFFDFQTGILTFNGSTAAFTKPFKVSGYRYVGEKGAGVSGTSGTSGTSGIDGGDGTSGTSGIDGVSGTSGTDGTDGSSGSSGSSGTSGTDGSSGTSGVDGVSGTSGTDGSSGTSGVDGVSGTSGTDGSSGSSGVSGTSGTSGIDGVSGTSGTDGTDGSSGTSGVDGVSGTSGTDGSSGSSGDSGSSGTSGVDGVSGTSGTDGSSGTSGIDGVSGTSGTDGSSGTSGIDGVDGSSGTSGVDGVSGTSGTDGSSGTSGIDGVSGTSGTDGTDGSSGSSGSSGTSGVGVDGTSGTSGIDGVDGADGTSGTPGFAGADGTSGTSGLAGTSGSSGTSGSGDGTMLMGDLPSGQTYDGLVDITATDQVNESVNWINEALLLIAPAKPTNLTGQALVLSGTTKYSAKLPSGLNAAWYADGSSAGATVTDYVVDNTFRVTSPSPTTEFYNGMYNNPGGTLQLFADSTSIDSISTASTGSSTNLTVSDVATYNSIWSKANAYADITQSAEGYIAYHFDHALAGSSNNTGIRYDNVASTPTFDVALSVAENTVQSKWLSGIEYYGLNTTLDISFTAAVGIFQKAYHPTAVAVVSQNAAAFASINLNPAATPAYNDTYAVSNYTVTLNVGSRASNSPSITVTLQKPNGVTAQSTANLAHRVCTYGTNSTTTADYFYDEAQRVNLGSLTSWTSTNALSNGNAQVRNGVLQFPDSTDYPGFTGDQEYQRMIVKASASTGSITFSGLTYTQISPYGSGDINVLIGLDTDGQIFDLGRVVGDNNGDGSGTSRANSKGGRSSGSSGVVNWSIGTYSTADNSSQYRVIIIFRNTNRTVISLVGA